MTSMNQPDKGAMAIDRWGGLQLAVRGRSTELARGTTTKRKKPVRRRCVVAMGERGENRQRRVQCAIDECVPFLPNEPHYHTGHQ